VVICMGSKKRRRDPERTQVARSTCGSVRSPLAFGPSPGTFSRDRNLLCLILTPLVNVKLVLHTHNTVPLL
jgi:hypothetical protein